MTNALGQRARVPYSTCPKNLELWRVQRLLVEYSKRDNGELDHAREFCMLLRFADAYRSCAPRFCPGRTRQIVCGLALAIAASAGPVLAEVPLNWNALGYVTVKAHLNGQGPFDFVFDTGADESSVYAAFARRLKLPAGNNTVLTGATGSADVSTVKIE
jgi:hypothetical protein